MSLRIVFVGCVQMSFVMLSRVLTRREVQVVGVITRRSSPQNADFCSLEPLARSRGIPVLLDDGSPQDGWRDWLVAQTPDLLYCFGWPRLLRRTVLDVPAGGGIGFHPAPLPRARGRHPLIWALVLGLSETASTFFYMDDGADSGDILSQRRLAIGPDDDAAALYARVVAIALEQIDEFTPQLAAGNAPRTPQDPRAATEWRRRGPADGRIDWRMSARSIHNLVRGLARPYVGAHCTYRGSDIRVWRARPWAGAVADDLEPGRVLAITEEGPVIKCGDGAIVLVEHEFPTLPARGAAL